MPRSPLSLSPSVLTVLALACASTACKGDAVAQLVSLAALEPGEDCAQGGIAIHTGDDTDENGTLDAAEVKVTEVVCNGEAAPPAPPGSLFTTTDLPEGDETCEYGGIRIEYGLDDGAGGGTAGDGILQEGEVDASEYACTPAPAWDVAEPIPPAGAGQFTVDFTGGAGTTGQGGDGGEIEIGTDGGEGGLGGGHVLVWSTGTADASFTMPTVGAYLGEDPAEVAADTVVTLLTSGTAPSAAVLDPGELFQEQIDGCPLYLWDGTSQSRITGLHVAAGATLTLPQVQGSGAAVCFEEDLHNEGGLTAAGSAIDIDADSYIGAAGSTISAPGARVDLQIEHLFVNAGTIDASGAASQGGGFIDIDADLGIRNSGDLLARGGDTATEGTAGGAGGGVSLEVESDASLSGGLYQSGLIDVSGGDGPLRGGAGGTVDFEVYGADIRSFGAIEASGGDGSCENPPPPATPTCVAGGDAAFWAIQMYAYSGSIYHDGAITADGGANLSGEGGWGGGIELYASDDLYANFLRSATSPPSIHLSGDLSARGGASVDGGEGGRLYVEVAKGDARGASQIVLYGYTSLTAPGGDGAAGGQGGHVEIENPCPYSSTPPVGGVINQADIDISGGAADGVSGRGGTAGYVDLMACTQSWVNHIGGSTLLNEGTIDARGGPGTDYDSGNGGDVYMEAFDGVENTAPIDVGGGDGAEGGSGGLVFIDVASGSLTNTAAILAAGGDGSDDIRFGGDGGEVTMYGASASNSGDLDVHGGDGGTFGGDGGEIDIFGADLASTQTGALDVSPGAGDPAGLPGNAHLDGANITEDALP